MATAKVLLVDANPETRGTLSKALTEAGYEVAVASSGSLALSTLEWERPDLIVSRAQVEDMDGYELFTRVRKDPTTMDTPFVLLAGLDRPIALAAAEAGVELIVAGEPTPEIVTARVGDVLRPGTLQDAPPPPASVSSASVSPAAPLWTALSTAAQKPVGTSDAAFQGSLDVMDLAEVIQAVALGGKTGCLTVSLTTGEGAIVFESGRVMHASHRGRTGEPAFAEIISVSQREPDARFRFDRAERAVVINGPRTISRSVERLLLSIAVGIDEGEPGAGSLEGASPARRTDR